ncbi:phytanoyl-CoA dioxygenase family protein [Armatimonas sp.]|uniref:phytanoyl-CoA dioxygenase family protein n=1 Tax=Armatimonas sp. TaxID=1872638 RepID=UPI00286A3E0E|nr:phytanoyl-CoA dioxygenase family protein [Armatimonas sp.]
MTITEALYELGVRDDTLSTDEKAQLDREGFLSLPGILDVATVAAMNQRLAELLDEEGEAAGKEVHQEPGTNRLANLVNKSALFLPGYTHPRVLAGIAHVLEGDLKLSSLNHRAALPGQGLQGLHADWSGATAPGQFYVCNSIWLLDDFTPDNGATRVVPGSHNSGKAPHEELSSPTDTHPREQLILGSAGTVVIFNSHTWHGGTLNHTEKPRRALHSYFTRRDQPQQTNQQASLHLNTIASLSEAARVVLEVTLP